MEKAEYLESNFGQMAEGAQSQTRRLRWAGAVLAGGALCATLAGTAVTARGEGGSALLVSLPDMPVLGRLQDLHWVNHEFRKMPAAAQPLTPLEKADAVAERQAQTAAHWGTLAATKDVFRSKEFEQQLQEMKQNAELSEVRVISCYARAHTHTHTHHIYTQHTHTPHTHTHTHTHTERSTEAPGPNRVRGQASESGAQGHLQHYR